MTNEILTESIAVLGSTGSVGRQTLEVARAMGMQVRALSACSNAELLEAQIRAFHPRMVALTDETAAAALRLSIADLDCRVLAGPDSVSELAESCEAETVCNSVTGIAGLRPTLAAIAGGHHVALANKETLVTAGDYVLEQAKRRGVRVIPVDSEHSAVFQCLQDHRTADCEVSRIILTASGGAFRGKTRDALAAVTPADALRHPTWRMGPKITVDCASLANKGLEVIEAARLFGLCADQIDVVVHPESIIHSMVEYIDHTVIAQLAVPDMRLCIQYALTYPSRMQSLTRPLDFASIGALHFERPDTDTFTLLNTAYAALRQGGTAPAAFNAANEEAVALFLAGKISFPELFDLVETVIRNWRADRETVLDLEAVEAADREARMAVHAVL